MYPSVKPSQTKEQLSCRIIKRSHAASRGNTHTMSGKSSSLYALHPVSKCGESNISSKESATQGCNTHISCSGLQNCSGLHGAKCITKRSYKMRKISIELIKKIENPDDCPCVPSEKNGEERYTHMVSRPARLLQPSSLLRKSDSPVLTLASHRPSHALASGPRLPSP